MAEIKWIKLTTTMFEDEKIDFIESLPESDSILVIWIKLLTLAGKCNMKGYIFLTENIPYNEEMLAHKFRRPLNIVRLAFETFRKLGMIEIDEGNGIYISNWEKHQNIDGMEHIRELTRERNKKYRERKKQSRLTNGDVNNDVNVTSHDGTDIDIDLDKEYTTTAEVNPFNFYEQNGFGTINPTIVGYINEWLDGNYFYEAEVILIKAMEEAVSNNVRKWSYVDKILINWDQNKLRTLNQVNAFLTEHKNNTTKSHGVKRKDALSILKDL